MHLESLNLEIPTNFSTEQRRDKSVFSAEVNVLTKKGNEGLRDHDPHTCCFCQKSISSRNALKRHLEAVHCKSTKMVCDLCPKFFFGRQNIIKHLKFVHDVKKLICNVCGYKAFTKFSLKNHKNSHAVKVETETNLVKKKPPEKFMYSAEVKSLARKGNEDLRKTDPHTCCFCQKVFSSRNHLKGHMETAHCKSTKMSCDLCSKLFYDRRTLERHTAFVHGEKKFTCNVCDFVTASKFSLKTHKLTHTAKVECPVCNKPVSSLKKHMRAHEPKESCPICQKPISKLSMKMHKKRAHKIG